jgi:hypothetical protein
VPVPSGYVGTHDSAISNCVAAVCASSKISALSLFTANSVPSAA